MVCPLLNFSKIIDIYIEPEEDEEDLKQVNESTWNIDSSWTNDCAKELYNSLTEKHDRINLRYTQSYISINIDGRNTYWFCKRMKPTSAMFFSVKDDEKVETIKKTLEENDIGYTYNRYKEFMLNVDLKSLQKNRDIIYKVHTIRNRKVADDE